MNERKPGVWTLRVFIGRDAGGRPVQVSRTCRGSKREAETALAKYVAELSESKPALEGVGATVGQLLDEWVQVGKQRGWTPYTEHRYRSYVEGRIRPALGSVTLTKFGPEHCDRFYAALLAEELSPTTVRHVHAILASACELAVDWGWLARNPAKRDTHLPARAPRTRAPSVDEITRIVDAAEQLDPVKAVLLVVAAMTGARRGELCALKWSDVDWERRTLTIARSLKHHSGRHGRRNDENEEVQNYLARCDGHGDPEDSPRAVLRLGEISRNRASRRGLHLFDFAGRLRARETRFPYSIPCPPDEETRNGLSVSRTPPLHGDFHGSLRCWHPYDCRSLGHADPALTLRTYAHWLETADRDAADIVENVLGGAMPG